MPGAEEVAVKTLNSSVTGAFVLLFGFFLCFFPLYLALPSAKQISLYLVARLNLVQ